MQACTQYTDEQKVTESVEELLESSNNGAVDARNKPPSPLPFITISIPTKRSAELQGDISPITTQESVGLETSEVRCSENLATEDSTPEDIEVSLLSDPRFSAFLIQSPSLR